MILWILVQFLWILPGFLANDDFHLKFPPGFTIGASSSAYQIEGGWNASDKGVSVWDWFAHEKNFLIEDGSNGDIACDSYHKYKEDIEIMEKYSTFCSRGSYDYFGLNHYTSKMVEPVPKMKGDLWHLDSGVRSFANASWPGCPTDWLSVVPEGLGGVLRDIKEAYNNPPVYILENGVSSNPGFADYNRIEFLYGYMKEMLLARNRDGCDVKVYTVWSLLDNFEWDRGYSERFGLIEVDFNNLNRTRTPRLSTRWLREIITRGKLMKLEDSELFRQLSQN
ncbi:myrosinase 1-like [Fopius arisanus]|uniref:beta-glucosidase n=1 Tax=Fopius arisanus TaxID=64838 RepID=A0A9R1T7L2_9HYME|nr:PREDICTED: myrosinase 1-like [Fopius arisanus]